MKVTYRKASEDLLKMSSPQKESPLQGRSSVNTVIEVEEHYLVGVEKLIPYHKQARRNFDEDEIIGLSHSIKEHGVRQPLTIIQSSVDKSKFEVISGERRLRAAKMSGLQKIPCIIISDCHLAEEISLVENIQRRDLHPVEMGEAFLKILEARDNLTQTSLAKKLGLSNKIISESIQYAKLQQEVKDFLIKRDIRSREFLRRAVKYNDSIEYLTPTTEIDLKIKTNNKSILRISLIENSFHVQAGPMSELSDERKKNLKDIFQNLLNSL